MTRLSLKSDGILSMQKENGKWLSNKEKGNPSKQHTNPREDTTEAYRGATWNGCLIASSTLPLSILLVHLWI
jgi:hypothetical protein